MIAYRIQDKNRGVEYLIDPSEVELILHESGWVN